MNMTYEDILEMRREPLPSQDKLRSRDRQERIDAVRELYNKVPTIISGGSCYRIRKTAERLYRQGLVRHANKMMEVLEDTANSHFSYVQDNESNYKILSSDESDGEKDITVEIVDKDQKDSIKKEFNSLSEAIDFFKDEE